MDSQVEGSVNDGGSNDGGEIETTSVFGFPTAEQQRTDNRQRVSTLSELDSDSIGRRFYHAEPVNLSTPADSNNSVDNVEGTAAPIRRSQYHSIQQLSQSGRPGDGGCSGGGGLYSGAEATVFGGQAWLGGCSGGGVDCEEDTLQVLRSLLRRYDRCAHAAAEPRPPRGTVDEAFDDGRHCDENDDEVASGMDSVVSDDVSGDDVGDYSPPVTLRLSPMTSKRMTLTRWALILRRIPVTLRWSSFIWRMLPLSLKQMTLTRSPVTLRRSPMTLKLSLKTLRRSRVTFRCSPVTLRRSPTTMTLQAKRARVEHIVSNIRTPGTCGTEDSVAAATTGLACPPASLSGPKLHGRTASDGPQRSKRKQTVPQQHDAATFDNEDHPSVNSNASDIDNNDADDDDDKDDDDNRMMLPRGQANLDDGLELRRQLRAIQLRLEDMYTKYAAKSSLQVDRNSYTSAARSPDNEHHLEPASKTMNNEAERLTNLLKAEVKHVVDGLVDGIIKRFLTKHFNGRPQQQPAPPPPSFPSTDNPQLLDFPRPLSPVTSLPVFPPPPPPPPPLFPFPVVNGTDVLRLRRAYAERCAYIDALVQRARSTCDTITEVNYNDNNLTSGPTMTSPMTSRASSEVVDRRSSLMSVVTSGCLLPDQQLLQPVRTQVFHR